MSEPYRYPTDDEIRAKLKVIEDGVVLLMKERDDWKAMASAVPAAVQTVALREMTDRAMALEEDRDRWMQSTEDMMEQGRAEVGSLTKERDRLRGEIVGSLTAAGIAMLVDADPTAPGEIASAVRRLAAERDTTTARAEKAEADLAAANERMTSAAHAFDVLRAELRATDERLVESDIQRDAEKARAENLYLTLEAESARANRLAGLIRAASEDLGNVIYQIETGEQRAAHDEVTAIRSRLDAAKEGAE